jgi:hypothetical protein
MAFAPLAILALENALEKRTGRALAPAALFIALVLLSNVPGTGGLGLAVFCWICSQARGRHGAAWLCASVAAGLAYGLACYGVPPSAVSTVAGNFGSMHPGFTGGLRLGLLLLVAVLGAAAAAGYALARTRLPLAVRFGLLYFALTATVVLTARSGKLEQLPQPGRLQLEMEMGACLLLGSLAWAIYSRIPRWSRPIAWVLCLAVVTVQFGHYHSAAVLYNKPAELGKRSEYTTARWLNANMNGQRVYAAGSTSFWLNAFSETPQMGGCCLQGQSMPLLPYVQNVIQYATGSGDTQTVKTWLRAFGVAALVVNGPTSTDEYKDIRAPERFEKLFTPRHRENGDTIYSVLDGPVSLAHVLRRGEPIPVVPPQQLNGLDLVRYAEIISDSSRPQASFEWVRGGAARIRAQLRRDDVVSVQVPWFRGWKAYAGGARKPVSPDGLGFMVIEPQCEGACEITLLWTGRPDQPFAAAVSIATLVLLAVIVYRGVP